jgi:hypothetical protein
MQHLAPVPLHALLALGVLLALAGAAGKAAAAELTDFFGTYVGNAQELDDTEPMARDIDIVIEPYHDEGFQIHWITVTKVDGRRDVPGVERDVNEVRFKPAEGKDFYVEVPRPNPFREREETRPMRGDPVRWAAIEGDSLYVYSFVVLDDGRYELQVYERELTDMGIDLDFQRLVDGQLAREIVGTTVRVGVTQGEQEGE